MAQLDSDVLPVRLMTPGAGRLLRSAKLLKSRHNAAGADRAVLPTCCCQILSISKEKFLSLVALPSYC